MTSGADLHQRGLAAAAAGEWERAVECLAAAVAAEPAGRTLHANLGLALVRAGRAVEAVTSYERALALAPDHGATLAKLGRALILAGERDRGIATLERASAAEPACADTANALGAAQAAAGRRDAARRALTRAVELDPGFGEAWGNLALLDAGAGRWAEAAHAFERAVALEPPSADLYYRLGVARARAGRRQEAVVEYRRAVALDPRMAEAWNNLGHELAAQSGPNEALDAVGRALAVRPQYVDARYNLGVTLQSLGRIDDARRAYQLVLAGAGAHADTLNNLGGLCLSEAAPALAAPLYARALAADPRHPEARWNLGLAQLAAGDWAEGWPNYEARPAARSFGAPRWRRGDPLDGRSVLLWCEQGLGDGVQFLRYAAELRRLGAGRIAVECPRALAGLFALAEGIDAIVVRGAAGAPPVDYQISAMSLPFELATRVDAAPAPGPVYRLPAERRAEWRARLDGLGPGPKAGIVWGGSLDNRAGLSRSMPLGGLARLGERVKLVSLQHGPQRADLAAHPEIADWEQRDLADTAALVAELDLVITVDTLMAHLAGTLARETWVALPYAADWRWMTARADSPWYPGMRLFRQSKPGDWRGATDRMAEALAASGTTAAVRPG